MSTQERLDDLLREIYMWAGAAGEHKDYVDGQMVKLVELVQQMVREEN